MAIIVILCGAPHLYKKDMNNSGSKIKIINQSPTGLFEKVIDLQQI